MEHVKVSKVTIGELILALDIQVSDMHADEENARCVADVLAKYF